MRRPIKGVQAVNTTLQGDSAIPQQTITPEQTAGMHEKVRRLELISELFEICNSTTNLNELMDRVFKKVVQDVGAEAGSLWLTNDENTEITCHVAEGPTRDKIVGMKLPKGSGVVGFVIDTCESRTVFDASKDAQFANSVDQKTGFKTRSMICAPLIVEKSAIGAIQLLNKKTVDGKFNPEDLNLLHMLCQSSATPIVNARLRTSEQKVQELSTLLEISNEITSTLDLDSCMLSVVNLCSKLIPYDRAVIALNDKDSIKISAISGQMTINVQDQDIINLKTMLEGVCKKGEDVYIPAGKKYLKTDSPAPYIEAYVKRYHPGTLAIYRLYDDESDLGLFMMESSKENLIAGSLSDRVKLLKNMMTVALRNAQLYNAVPSLSVFKSLAGGSSLPLKKMGVAAALILILAGALWFIRPPYAVVGKFEVRPVQKYMLFSPLDNAIVSHVVADPATMVGKGDTLLTFETGELVQELKNKENDLLMLKQKIGLLRQQSKQSDYHAKRLELQKTELETAALRRKIDESVLCAPVSGRLVNDDIKNMAHRKFNKGDELIEIIPSGAMQLKLFISERDVHRINPGQICRFRVPAYPGKTFCGSVEQLAFDTKDEEDVLFPVLISVQDSSALLFPGMSGRGKITTEKEPVLYRLLAKPREYIAIKLWF